MSTVFRKPRRLTITVSQHVMERLQNSSDQQGRSLSNYAAYLLECALHRSATEVERHEPVSYTHLTLPTTPYV